MSTMIGARIEDDVLQSIEYVAEEEKVDKSTAIRELLAEAVRQKMIELALQKYAQRRVSLGRGAELAHMPLVEFMTLAAERKIPLNYSLASLQQDLRAAR